MSDLEERQARDTADLTRELIHPEPLLIPPGPCPICGSPPCPMGDEAWHRAVQRLCRIHGGDYIRLLSEERRSTTRAEVTDPYEGGHADRDGADDDPLGEPT